MTWAWTPSKSLNKIRESSRSRFQLDESKKTKVSLTSQLMKALPPAPPNRPQTSGRNLIAPLWTSNSRLLRQSWTLMLKARTPPLCARTAWWSSHSWLAWAAPKTLWTQFRAWSQQTKLNSSCSWIKWTLNYSRRAPYLIWWRQPSKSLQPASHSCSSPPEGRVASLFLKTTKVTKTCSRWSAPKEWLRRASPWLPTQTTPKSLVRF